jgi:hypothetical protein
MVGTLRSAVGKDSEMLRRLWDVICTPVYWSAFLFSSLREQKPRQDAKGKGVDTVRMLRKSILSGTEGN